MKKAILVQRVFILTTGVVCALCTISCAADNDIDMRSDGSYVPGPQEIGFVKEGTVLAVDQSSLTKFFQTLDSKDNYTEKMLISSGKIVIVPEPEAVVMINDHIRNADLGEFSRISYKQKEYWVKFGQARIYVSSPLNRGFSTAPIQEPPVHKVVGRSRNVRE